MNLAILICATERYQFALSAQAIAIQQNVFAANLKGGHLIFVTCEKPVSKMLAMYKDLLGENWQIHHLPLKLHDAPKSYDSNACNIVATMLNVGVAKARSLDVDRLWLLDSDVLPEANNLRCMDDMLAFDGGYYEMAFVPYTSAGGGDIMGGRGSHRRWIYPSVYDDERQIPKELLDEALAHQAKAEKDKAWRDEWARLEEEIRKCPHENIFALNAREWRPRGWLSAAYPGIGKGAVVPSDWAPTGNNLLSRKAIGLLDVMGYQLSGTNDLYATFHRLAPYGVRICVIPHCLSHHVQRKIDPATGEKDDFLYFLYHEKDGPCEGHLRVRKDKWYSFVAD